MTRLRIPVAVSLAVLAAAGHAALSPAAASRTVTVTDDAFTPKRLTIAKGTLVMFRWTKASHAHDVVSRGRKRFRNSKIKSTGTHRVRFARTGTYNYVCTLHEDRGMTGRIVVR